MKMRNERKYFVQRILGFMRKAIQEFDLIQNGDKIAVGISGGKDSLVLLEGLARLRRFLGIDFSLVGLTLDLRFGGQSEDYSQIAKLCEQWDIPYIVKRTDIASIVFDIRREPHPCSLCARLRRGALHDLAIEHECNKIAFGHHFDDAVETFFMNLFNEGRIACFSPKTYLSRKKITLIRPMVFAPEKEVRRAAFRRELPIIKSQCPADGASNREKIKQFLADRNQTDKGFSDRVFGAIRRAGINGWGFREAPVENSHFLH